jgi:small multidrug resistance pump
VPVVAMFLAIVAEVTGTLALRGSHGFTRPLPSVLVVLGYLAAFGLLAYALRTLAVGPVYAIWSGVGTIGASVGGALLFGERLTTPVVAGIALVVLGVIVINLGGTASQS